MDPEHENVRWQREHLEGDNVGWIDSQSLQEDINSLTRCSIASCFWSSTQVNVSLSMLVITKIVQVFFLHNKKLAQKLCTNFCLLQNSCTILVQVFFSCASLKGSCYFKIILYCKWATRLSSPILTIGVGKKWKVGRLSVKRWRTEAPKKVEYGKAVSSPHWGSVCILVVMCSEIAEVT